MARPTGYSLLRGFTLLAPVLLLLVRWTVQRSETPSSCPRDPSDGTIQPVRGSHTSHSNSNDHSTSGGASGGMMAMVQDSGDCFFSESYFEARKQFRFLAQAANAELHSVDITEHLTMDVAVLRGTNPNRTLLHLSGVHGQEGYAGSAIQAALLNKFARNRDADGELVPPDVTVVFVHAVNPFGFHHDRRVNEDNIDLNRNFLTPEKFDMAWSRDPNFAGYVEADPYFNPQEVSENTYVNDIVNVRNIVMAVVKMGFGNMKRALVSGNYWKPKGLGFGGRKLSKSAEALVGIVRDNSLGVFSEHPEAFISIDVHTGLGPQGVDTLAVENPALLQYVDETFPMEFAPPGLVDSLLSRAVSLVTGAPYARPLQPSGGLKDGMVGGTGALSGYDLTIGTIDALCKDFKNPSLDPSRMLCMTQEFGTIFSPLVGMALSKENAAFWWSPNEKVKKHFGRELRNAFFVNRPSWKRNVVRRGVAVFEQAYNKLKISPNLVVE